MTGDKPTEKQFKWVPPRDGKPSPEIYANFTHSSWTNYDVRIRLGQLVPELDYGGEFVVEERASVTITWQHAKYIAGALAELVQSYEKANGQIPVLKLPSDPTTKRPPRE